MAGQSKKRATTGTGAEGATGSRPNTPGTATTPRCLMDGPFKGHLGLKSSPFAPTDCKLISQYMVLDHMTAHYKKVSKAKAAVDTSPPKTWLVSQKVRDRIRRDVLKQGSPRPQEWQQEHYGYSTNYQPGSSRASSEIAREELIAALQSEFDEEDGKRGNASVRLQSEGNTTVAANPSDGTSLHLDHRDYSFVDKMVQDNTNSPSHYHHTRPMKSYIPQDSKTRRSGSTKHGRSVHQSLVKGRPGQGNHASVVNTSASQTFGGAYYGQHSSEKPSSTPRSKDLLDTKAHKFTEEKPFQPRTLRTSSSSKLVQFKYYNRPKKQVSVQDDEVDGVPQPKATINGHVREHRGSIVSRPETESVDLMNETLMSRGGPQNRPDGVPPLDMSLDADHLQWIKEQSRRGQLRTAYSNRTWSDAGSDVGSLRSTGMKVPHCSTVTKSRQRPSGTMTGTRRMSIDKEDEVRYLEFIKDVTEDVLDRGIFTNRALKQVFESHIEKRKHDLKISRMREMLEELRMDLGIPADNETNGGRLEGARSWSPDDVMQPLESRDSLCSDQTAVGGERARGSRRRNRSGAGLRGSGYRRTPAEGRPPLPHSGGVGYRNRSRPGSAASSLANTEIREEWEPEGDHYNQLSRDTFGTMSMKPGQTMADILTINHGESPDILEEADEEREKLHADDNLVSSMGSPADENGGVTMAAEASTFPAPDEFRQTSTGNINGVAHSEDAKTVSDAPYSEADASSVRDGDDLTMKYEDALRDDEFELPEDEDEDHIGEENFDENSSGKFHSKHAKREAEHQDDNTSGQFHSDQAHQSEEEQQAEATSGTSYQEDDVAVDFNVHTAYKYEKNFQSDKDSLQQNNQVVDGKFHSDRESIPQEDEGCNGQQVRVSDEHHLDQSDLVTKHNTHYTLTGNEKGTNSEQGSTDEQLQEVDGTVKESEKDQGSSVSLEGIPEQSEGASLPQRPAPWRRPLSTPHSDTKETPRSQELTHTSDSVEVSDLEDDQLGDF